MQQVRYIMIRGDDDDGDHDDRRIPTGARERAGLEVFSGVLYRWLWWRWSSLLQWLQWWFDHDNVSSLIAGLLSFTISDPPALESSPSCKVWLLFALQECPQQIATNSVFKIESSNSIYLGWLFKIVSSLGRLKSEKLGSTTWKTANLWNFVLKSVVA